MLKSAFLALLLLAPACVAAQTPHPAEQIAVAERAFAADGLALGVKPSFLKWSSPEAILLLAEPTNVHRFFAGRPDPQPGAPALIWWPTWTGVARSGDLGISTGPVETGGRRASHYFTVWKKQAPNAEGGGGWKWIYDGGVGASGEGEPVRPIPATHLPVASLGSASPAAALAEVRDAEAAFSQAAASDQAAAHLAVLADDGRLYVEPLPPAKGKVDFPKTLEAYPKTLTLGAPLGGESSAAGDLVFVYGKAGWGDVAGHYVHIWQKRPEGWKLVFSQLLPAPPPPAAG